jgi:D-glycero-alpha-D-manno-heptose-7-phosphate kinase
VQIIKNGHVRIDFLGGTLDIDPICHILPQTITINAAINLNAKVSIRSSENNILKLISSNYNKTISSEWTELTEENIFQENYFEELNFAAALVYWFKQNKYLINNMGIIVDMNAMAPAGSGLGGSSALGIGIFKGLMSFLNVKLDRISILTIVKNIEAKILKSGPTGYQDYFPSLYGGVLCLKAQKDGVKYLQIYSEQFCNFIEQRVTLAYSNQSRLSGINNWEVIKNFFDDDGKTHEALLDIACLSKKAEKCLKIKDFNKFLELVKEEGKLRAKLFSNIETLPIQVLKKELEGQDNKIGLKMCGAGGGGCFIIIHEKHQMQFVANTLKKHNMDKIAFEIIKPL